MLSYGITAGLSGSRGLLWLEIYSSKRLRIRAVQRRVFTDGNFEVRDYADLVLVSTAMRFDATRERWQLFAVVSLHQWRQWPATKSGDDDSCVHGTRV